MIQYRDKNLYFTVDINLYYEVSRFVVFDELQDNAENLKKLFQFLGLMFNLYTVLSCNVYAGTDT